MRRVLTAGCPRRSGQAVDAQRQRRAGRTGVRVRGVNRHVAISMVKRRSALVLGRTGALRRQVAHRLLSLPPRDPSPQARTKVVPRGSRALLPLSSLVPFSKGPRPKADATHLSAHAVFRGPGRTRHTLREGLASVCPSSRHPGGSRCAPRQFGPTPTGTGPPPPPSTPSTPLKPVEEAGRRPAHLPARVLECPPSSLGQEATHGGRYVPVRSRSDLVGGAVGRDPVGPELRKSVNVAPLPQGRPPAVHPTGEPRSTSAPEAEESIGAARWLPRASSVPMLRGGSVGVAAGPAGPAGALQPCFEPTFRTFCAMAGGFLAQTRRRTVWGMLTGAGLARRWSSHRVHRFFCTGAVVAR